jgi:hypothetical protein
MTITIIPKPLKTVAKLWLVTSLVSIALLLLLYVGTYYFWAFKKYTLIGYLTHYSYFIVGYSTLYAVVQAFQYRMKTMEVNSSVGIDINQIVSFLELRKWHVVERDQQKVLLNHNSWFERLMLNENKISIAQNGNHLTIELPSKLAYHINHGFNYGYFQKENVEKE